MTDTPPFDFRSLISSDEDARAQRRDEIASALDTLVFYGARQGLVQSILLAIHLSNRDNFSLRDTEAIMDRLGVSWPNRQPQKRNGQ